MNKKYQVFVSSTYEDLRVERGYECTRVGLHTFSNGVFPVADEDQWS